MGGSHVARNMTPRIPSFRWELNALAASPDGSMFERVFTAIRLDPVARLDRDQRWCHHHAAMPRAGQQPVQPIAAGTTSSQKLSRRPLLPRRAASCSGSLGGSRTPRMPYLPAATVLGNRSATVALCTSSPTSVISSIAPSSMHEALCRSFGTTLDIVHDEDGPPITQRIWGLGNRPRFHKSFSLHLIVNHGP